MFGEDGMKNPIRDAWNYLDPQTALEEGTAFRHRQPVLSPEKRKELMAASGMETPRSTFRSVMDIMAPYWTQSSKKEKTIAVGLMATSLAMTWWAVDMRVEFGEWMNAIGNTMQQIYQTVTAARPDIIKDAIPHYPALQDAMSKHEIWNGILHQFPDVTNIYFDPQFKGVIEANPHLAEILQKTPTMQQVFMQLPDFKEAVQQNPDLLNQLTALGTEIGNKSSELPRVQKMADNMLALAGGNFFKNTGNAISTVFNTVAHGGNPLGQPVREALSDAWKSRDMITIAGKFTAMAITSYKAAQYLTLRWRAWSTGYFGNKWTDSKAYARLKNNFNNIDNPGQRIQEDPRAFTDGAVALMTGVAGAAIALPKFSRQLWEMGTVGGVPHGFFWTGAAYAAFVTGLTLAVGKNLPEIQRNQQRREGDLRAELDRVHNNADVIAQNGGEDVENDLIKTKFKPVIKNSLRQIGTTVKLTVVDATSGNASISIPYLAATFAGIMTATASIGTASTLTYAFSMVTSSLSFVVNNFGTLAQMKATADRISTFNAAVETTRYIEEERHQAGLKVKIPSYPPGAGPSAAPKGP
jgi:putative ATP-binding cassette transporter